MLELPTLELAADLAIEGRRVLLGHWVAASVEPLQSCLQILHRLQLDDAGALAARALEIESQALLSLALDAGARFGAAAQARQAVERRLAQGMDPLGQAMALSLLGCAAQLRGDVPAMLRLGERAAQVIQERDALAAAAPLHALLGWALVMDGEVDEGLDALEAGLIHYRRHGSVLSVPWMLSVCAEARLAAGAMDEARRDIEAAHAGISAEAGNRFMQGAAWRVRGNLRWAAGEGLAAARQDWDQALAVDHAAGAVLCELQTTLVLGRALAASGDKAQARERLSQVLERAELPAPGMPICPVLDIGRRQLAAWA
jgi:tetratricopeptide (TPR) repeat protein